MYRCYRTSVCGLRYDCIVWAKFFITVAWISWVLNLHAWSTKFRLEGRSHVCDTMATKWTVLWTRRWNSLSVPRVRANCHHAWSHEAYKLRRMLLCCCRYSQWILRCPQLLRRWYRPRGSYWGVHCEIDQSDAFWKNCQLKLCIRYHNQPKGDSCRIYPSAEQLHYFVIFSCSILDCCSRSSEPQWRPIVYFGLCVWM